jgi:hypothetical protein
MNIMTMTRCEKEAIFNNVRSDNMTMMLNMPIEDIKLLRKECPAKAIQMLSEAYEES